MNIPLLDLKREYQFFRKEIETQIKRCLKNQQWILGPVVEEFEAQCARYLGVRHTIGVASGTDALLLALHAFALQHKGTIFFDKSDEIITTPFTFIATPEAIMRAGARPVFVDINPETFNIDPLEVEKAINKNTVGIIPVHLFGLPTPMDKIMAIARKRGLFVVEDACQAFGARDRAKPAGTMGDAGAFSFFPSKNLGCYGDGGLVTVKSSKTANIIKILRNHGQTSQYNAEYLGYNSRLDALQAAILLVKLRHIDTLNRKRIAIAQKYNQSLKDIPQIKVPQLSAVDKKSSASHSHHIYHLYTIKIAALRDRLLAYLDSRGIAARVYYPILLPDMKVFSGAKARGKLLNARRCAAQALSLPGHPFLKSTELTYITDTINTFFKKSG